MSRRRVVVLASAATMFAIVGLAAFAVLFTTRTQWGREKIRGYVNELLNRSVKSAKWYIGPIHGSLFTNLQVDSFAIREPNDSLFVSTGRVHIRFDPRDIWDRRILVRELRIENPVVNVRQDSLGKWNYRKIFPSNPPGPKKTTRGFGDYIVVTNATLRGLTFELTMPWRPADSLSGARRDSAIAFGLNRKDKIIQRAGSNFVITRRWTEGNVQLGYARVQDPDSAGRFFQVQRLDVDEFDPPLKVTEATGTVRILGDSVWADFNYFKLPGSHGRAAGKVWWGSDLPTRYDVRVKGDSVSLSDVAWVYPTLPTTGGGSMDLRIRNQRDLRILDYEISNMDVRTVGSRLRGDMTFGVGGPVLVVKNLDVQATPIDWQLIEDFTGEPLPYPWKGKITADVKATGGPVNAFRIESANFSFVDANVPGARAAGSARGELNILFPAFTKFRAFDVNLERFDLATLQFLNPTFPRLDGWINGRATLDSVWTDVRFRNADLTHHFEEEPASRFTGSGRVTLGEKFLTYDLAMQAQPLELTTIARAWPELLLEQRGSLTGPVRIQGTAEDLDVSTELTGIPGTYGFDGRVDIDSVGGYAYRGTLRFTDANLRALYDTVSMPNTALTGTAEIDLRGDSLANYVGSIGLDLLRSRVDSTRLYEGARARFAFVDGKLRVDSLGAESPLGRLSARGSIGLRADQSDTMVVRFEADSLGGIRPYLLATMEDSIDRANIEADSLHGEVTANLTLAGSIDTLAVRGTIDGRELDIFSTTARRARARLALGHVGLPSLNGTASVTGDTINVATIGFRNAALDVTLHSTDSADVRVMAEETTGPVIEATAGVGIRGDTTRVAMSQGRIGFDDHEWTLDRRGVVRWWPDFFSIEGLSLAGNRGGHITLEGTAPRNDPVAMQLTVDSIALEDLAALGQSQVKLAGAMSLNVKATGTRASPLMDVTGRLVGTKVGQVNLSETSLSGRYADRRFHGSLGVLRGDTAVLRVEGNVPIDLAFEPRNRRLLDDSLRVSVVSRDVDLKLVESFTGEVSNARGRLNANVSIAGRPRATALEGYIQIDSAGAFVTDLGVEVRDFFADLRASRDTIRIQRFSMVSGETSRNRMSLDGFVAVADAEDRSFSLNLTANDFHVIDRSRIGDLTVSAGLRFQGREAASVLTGSVTVDNGYIVIPELSSKQIVNIDDPEFAAIVDTTLGGTRAVLPELPKLLQGLTAQNVQITMGPDVRMRSSEANIKLGGSVNVIRASGLSATGVPQLSVEGALTTERGTFLVRFGDVLYRLFAIEGGEVRFFGEPDFNPTLNIRAIYSVRQASQFYSNRNIRIRARVLGTLAQPRLAIESADSLQLSESDLFSYLITGRPSADIGGLNNAADFLLSSISSSFSARYSGRFFDYIQLQSVSGGINTQNRAQGLSALASTQLGVGKQLNDRTFVSLTTGFCPLQQFLGASATPNSIRASEMIGGSLEYTIRSGLGVSVSREPPIAAMLCSTEALGFAASRGSQWSLDFFRTWRW